MAYKRKGSSKVCDTPVKLLLIGESGVGKSCLLLRYCDNNFTSSYITTIGIDFKVKAVSIDGEEIKLQIWDTAGQERFRNITLAYFRGAMGIILVYDIGDPHSFQAVHHWMHSITENASDDINVVLVANKCDVLEARRVSTESGQELADSYGIPFFETSAKTAYNVDATFTRLARDIIARLRASRDRGDDAAGLAGRKPPKRVELEGIDVANGGDARRQRIRDYCSCNNVQVASNGSGRSSGKSVSGGNGGNSGNERKNGKRDSNHSNHSKSGNHSKNSKRGNESKNSNDGSKKDIEDGSDKAVQNASGSKFRRPSIPNFSASSLRLSAAKFGKKNKNKSKNEDKNESNVDNNSEENKTDTDTSSGARQESKAMDDEKQIENSNTKSFQAKFSMFQQSMKETARQQKDWLEASRSRLRQQRRMKQNSNDNEQNESNPQSFVAVSGAQPIDNTADFLNIDDSNLTNGNGNANAIGNDTGNGNGGKAQEVDPLSLI